MKKLHLMTAALTVASTMCGSSVVAQDSAGPKARLGIKGLITEAASKGTYVFVGLDNLSLGSEGNPIRAKLPLVTSSGEPEPIEVREAAVKIEVLQRSPRRSKFNILLGPKLCPDTAPKYLCDTNQAIGSGWISRDEGAGAKLKGTTLFHLEQGWAVLWSNPSGVYAESDWVIGGTEGSSMIIEIVDSETQRVYFREGKKLKLWCKLNQAALPTGDKDTVGKYLELTSDGKTCF